MPGPFKVRTISFEECKSYWLEVDHFKEPHKNILEFVKTLGPFETCFDNPKRQAYGLFSSNRLIGVTQLVEWTGDWVRYRTINILPEFQGQNLGWFLVEEAYKSDWQSYPFLFGWVRDGHDLWAKRNSFEEIPESAQDGHRGMLKDMRKK